MVQTKVGRPRKTKGGKGSGRPSAWHSSEVKSEASKEKVRDERGLFLQKRQLRIDIFYVPEDQLFKTKIFSGDKKVDEEISPAGIQSLCRQIERNVKLWKGALE